VKTGYSDRFKGENAVTVPPVLIVVIIVVVVIGLIFGGMYAMNQVVSTSYDKVDAIVKLSGNDVVVTIIGGDDAPKVSGLHTYIDGRESNAPGNTKRSIVLGEPVIFTDLARGVTGTGFVVVEALFNDGQRGVITYSRMQFS
jgi:hypothetical protein